MVRIMTTETNKYGDWLDYCDEHIMFVRPLPEIDTGAFECLKVVPHIDEDGTVSMLHEVIFMDDFSLSNSHGTNELNHILQGFGYKDFDDFVRDTKGDNTLDSTENNPTSLDLSYLASLICESHDHGLKLSPEDAQLSVQRITSIRCSLDYFHTLAGCDTHNPFPNNISLQQSGHGHNNDISADNHFSTDSKLPESQQSLKQDTSLYQNTKINYLYRDADNNMRHNEFIINGILTSTQKAAILDCLDDGSYFIPSLVGMPEIKFDEADDPAIDHQWFELQADGFEITAERSTTLFTADELVAAFQKCKNNWMDIYFGHSIELPLDKQIELAKERVDSPSFASSASRNMAKREL